MGRAGRHRALTFSVSFRLPSYGTVACALAALGGIAVQLYNNRQTLRIYAAHPQLGMVYFDAQDAALMGHRGMNLASAWLWGLLGTGVLPIAFTEWMLNRLLG
jgi:hypothetical protein